MAGLALPAIAAAAPDIAKAAPAVAKEAGNAITTLIKWVIGGIIVLIVMIVFLTREGFSLPKFAKTGNPHDRK